MIRFESLLNEQRSSAAVTKVTGAHAGEFIRFSGVGWQSIRRPSSGAIGYPAAFAACWSNPNSSASGLVNNSQRPPGLEFDDVAIVDDSRVEWIDDYQIGFSQLKTWSEPHQKNCAGYCKTQCEIEPVSGWVHHCLNQVQEGKGHPNCAPNKVAFRLESFTFTHSSIFTGISANGKGK